MSKIKLCVITPAHWSAFMGGAQYQVKCILDRLLPTGRYDVTYLANRIDPEFRPSSYSIQHVGTGVSRLGYLTHSFPLYRALKEIGPDVIYQRVACGYTGIAAWYAKRNGARMVWHVAHDGDVAPGRLAYGRNPLRSLLELRSVEYAIRYADAIVTQTKYQAELLKSNYGRTADSVIPNFHPLPTEVVDKSGPLTVVWVANLKRWKQPEVFIRLAEAFSDSPQVRFVMIGAPPTSGPDLVWYTDLQKAIADRSNLEYWGQRTQDEVNELLARAHVFVNTSLHEGFANTFIQSWMRKVPVVSLHVNPDHVFDCERVGFHAETEDRLQEVVRSLIEDRVKRESYGANAYLYAENHHSIQNVTSLEALFCNSDKVGNENCRT